MMKAKKTIVILLIFMCVLAIFSSLFVYMESHHDCDGDDCPVCAILRVASNAGKYLFALFIVVFALWRPSYSTRFVLHKIRASFRNTLISLKTKLSA